LQCADQLSRPRAAVQHCTSAKLCRRPCVTPVLCSPAATSACIRTSMSAGERRLHLAPSLTPNKCHHTPPPAGPFLPLIVCATAAPRTALHL
jgi:hypothetical protein